MRTSRGTMFDLARHAARSLWCVGFVAAVALLASAACSGSSVCNDSQCAPGNRCLALNGEVKCRKTCSSNTNPAESCPYGYTCTDTLSGAPPFCVAVDARLPDGRLIERRPGQWGQQCQPNLGLENPACDVDQGFYCFAQSPSDANAYCTRYDCTRDEECGPGFWCGQVNQTPNVATARRSTIGEVQNVCLKRGYCATCRADLDCLPVEGRNQRCIVDENETGVCVPECEESTNCPNEARCADVGIVKDDGTPQLVCYPRAGRCVGDGSLCSPCRVDTDCGDDGICVQGEYTTERTCAKKASNGCRSCPSRVETPARAVGCRTTASDRLPAEYCVGVYKIGGIEADMGCWTPDRR